MRFLVIVKASKECEAGGPPNAEFEKELAKYNEDLAKAGVLVALERLHPSSRGVRLQFSGKKRTVIDGPFAESKELVGGIWLWECKSMEEAVGWLKRVPFYDGAELELRPVRDPADFARPATS
jgi:hypothetical protein